MEVTGDLPKNNLITAIILSFVHSMIGRSANQFQWLLTHFSEISTQFPITENI